MLPNFIIIGAQKSATTYLHMCLMEHPDVFMTSEEIPFFIDPDYSQSNFKEFEKLFNGGHQKKRIGFKRPDYLHRPECPGRIYKHLPHARLIGILRDPVERAVSAYYHNIRMGFIPLVEANTGIPNILSSKWAIKYPRSGEILEYGLYCKHLNLYFDYFDKAQILMLLHDDILTDRMGSLRKVFRFLDIDENYIPGSIDKQINMGIYSIFRLRLLRMQNQVVYRYSKDGKRLYKHEENGSLAKKWVKILNRLDYLISLLLRGKQVYLNKEAEMMLADYYMEDTARLEKLLGISLRHWKPFRY